MKKTRSTKATAPANHPLLNIITPVGGLEFRRNKIYLGENACRIYAITAYPSTVEMGWLSKISNIPRTVSAQIFLPVNNGDLVQSLSRSVSQNRGIAESTRDALTRQRAEKAAHDAESLMEQIDQLGETVGYMVNLIMPVARDDAELETLCRQVESAVAVQKCKARALSNLQIQAFQSLAPYHTVNADISSIARRNIALSTYMGGFPFASNGFSDDQGYYFARDSLGGLIILNTWMRGGDRTNSNWVFMGVPGVGKSTAVKHMAEMEFATGIKLLFINPEREYKHFCESVGGDWLNSGGGGGMKNPLEFGMPLLDEDAEEDEKGLGALALHFKTLEIFFKLYSPDMTEIQLAAMKELLEETYAAFSITWNTDVSGFAATDFPIFTDLYNTLLKKQERAQAGHAADMLEYLCAIVRELALGADSFLWNGHTTINPRSGCICLDTFDLNNASERVKKTHYFVLLTWCWEQMSRDRSERVLLISDETYLMVDPQVPQSLIFLRNVAKRARKYTAGIAVVSHSVVDFLDPAIKMYGQALLDTPCYKVLMGTDGKNLLETADLHNLTDVEQDILASKKRKQALFMAGSKRMLIDFDIPVYKFAYFGDAGGN